MSTAVIWSISKPEVEFRQGGRLGEFNDMSSQSHVSRCRVLPLGEFTVMIPEPHATLQGVIIPSAILKIVFRHILFFFVFLVQFGHWRATAFVSSPIHLLTFLYAAQLVTVTSFLPRAAMHSANYAVARCVSVRQSFLPLSTAAPF